MKATLLLASCVAIIVPAAFAVDAQVAVEKITAIEVLAKALLSPDADEALRVAVKKMMEAVATDSEA